MKRATAIVDSLAFCVGGLVAPVPATAAPADTTPKPSGYTPPPLSWGACEDPTLQSFGSECADLVVPLDYSCPGGRKITLAVSRLKHHRLIPPTRA